MERENWENVSMASTMTDIEQVSNLAKQLGHSGSKTNFMIDSGYRAYM